MPDILFNCRGCQQQLVVDVSGAGLTISCPACGQPVKVPAKGDTGLIRVRESATRKSRVDALEEELGRERKRAGQAEASLQTLGDRLEQAEKTGAHAKAESQRHLREWENSVATARKEDEAARKIIEQWRIERGKCEAEAGKATLALEVFREQSKKKEAALERELAARQSETKALAEKLTAFENKLEDERAKAAARGKTVHELQTRLDEANVKLAEVAELNAHRDRLDVELAEARAALLRTETQLYHAISAREGLTAMVGNLRANLEGTTELYQTMLGTVDALENQVQRLESKLKGRGREALAS